MSPTRSPSRREEGSPLRREEGSPLRHEEGSSLVVALLSLVVLTLAGITLAIVSQTEMALGGNERTLERTFYAAEAGLVPAVPRALIQADYREVDITLPEIGPAEVIGMRQEIQVSPLVPILVAPCDLCEIGNAAVYNEKYYYDVTHALTSESRRVGGPAASSGALAEKALSVMIDLQPVEVVASTPALLEDNDALARVRF